MTNPKPCYATLQNYGLEQVFRPILTPVPSTMLLPMFEIAKPNTIPQPTFSYENNYSNNFTAYNNNYTTSYSSAYKCPKDFSFVNQGANFSVQEKINQQGVDYYNNI